MVFEFGLAALLQLVGCLEAQRAPPRAALAIASRSLKRRPKSTTPIKSSSSRMVEIASSTTAWPLCPVLQTAALGHGQSATEKCGLSRKGTGSWFLPKEGEIARYSAGVIPVFGELARQYRLLPAHAQGLGGESGQGQRDRYRPGCGKQQAQGGHALAEVERMPAEAVRAVRDQAPGLGKDRERPPQKGQRPDRIGHAGGQEQAAGQLHFRAPAPIREQPDQHDRE